MSRKLLVVADKTFRITIPDEAKITFGPWSPGKGEDKFDTYGVKKNNGTLRVYENHSSGAGVLAVFSGVVSYRDTAIEYEEQVTAEQGATVWNSDRNGYSREEKVSRSSEWVDPIDAPKELTAGAPKRARTKKAADL